METFNEVLTQASLSNVPPSGGSLEIGNGGVKPLPTTFADHPVPPSGGSLEIGNFYADLLLSSQPRFCACSPFGGIPRNWKLWSSLDLSDRGLCLAVPPSGGSLEIGNFITTSLHQG